MDLLDRIEGRVAGVRHEWYSSFEQETLHFDSQNYKWTSCDEYKFYLDYGTTPVRMGDKWVRNNSVRHYLIDEARAATEKDVNYRNNLGVLREVKKVTP